MMTEQTGVSNGSGSGELTIEQLAQASGLSVRNIRNHQSRGLLPSPEVKARVGYYGERHVERLRLIKRMQSEGFNLSAIEKLLNNAEGVAERLPGILEAAKETFATEAPETVSLKDLKRRYGPIDQAEVQRAVALDLLRPLGEDRFEAPSPPLLDAAEELIRMGIPLAAALSVMERMKNDCESVSDSFTNLFLDELWQPFEEQDQPTERLDEMQAIIERLRPLASRALLATFDQVMTVKVQETMGVILKRQVDRAQPDP